MFSYRQRPVNDGDFFMQSSNKENNHYDDNKPRDNDGKHSKIQATFIPPNIEGIKAKGRNVWICFVQKCTKCNYGNQQYNLKKWSVALQIMK